MGDFDGHPFRGNQYTAGQSVRMTNPNDTTTYKVMDPGEGSEYVMLHAPDGRGGLTWPKAALRPESPGETAARTGGGGVTVSRGDYKDVRLSRAKEVLKNQRKTDWAQLSNEEQRQIRIARATVDRAADRARRERVLSARDKRAAG